MTNFLGRMRAGGLAVLLLLVASAAHADDPSTGFYIGAGVGTATLELEDPNSTADFDGDDTGFKLVAGYRFLKWVAVEASRAGTGPSRRCLSASTSARTTPTCWTF